MYIVPINACNMSRRQNSYQQKPSFKSVFAVSDVILDDKSYLKGDLYKKVISKAVRILKDSKNSDTPFVKNFWNLALARDNSKLIQRSGNFIVQGSEAEHLADLSAEIPHLRGDIEAYRSAVSDFLADKKYRFKLSDGREQRLYIRAHKDKKRMIQIDDIGFKFVGQKVPENKSLQQTAKAPVKNIIKEEIKPYKSSNTPDWPAKRPDSPPAKKKPTTSSNTQNEFSFD